MAKKTVRDDGIIMYTNGRLARMLRSPNQTLAGKSFRNFLTAESLPVFESLWQRSRIEPSRGEVTLTATDGSQVDVQLTLNLLPSEEPIQTSVVITDLTEQKRHQEMVAAEAYARERAKELAEADRRKDEFLAMLAHELRNPLAPIRNGIDVLRTVPPNEEQTKQILDMMADQVYNLVRLIDDLLDVSRCTRGKLELRRQRVTLTYLPSLLAIIVPSLLASIFYCKLARRLGIGRKWMLLSCMVVAVLALVFQCSFYFSNVSGENNGFRLGFGWFGFDLWQLLQFLVPLVVALWFIRRSRSDGQLQLAS